MTDHDQPDPYRGDVPPPDSSVTNSGDARLVMITLRVSRGLRSRFRMAAAAHNQSMNERLTQFVVDDVAAAREKGYLGPSLPDEL